ncbi:MAG: hypothetical protein J6S06_01880 [Alphaproteobacteria bacterium]|nr:hypothetical protein [Alphaproteobacteria bacterium]
MKLNPCALLLMALCVLAGPAMGAVSIKKAAPVSTKQTTVVDSTASLVPTVLSLVTGVKQLNSQVRALEAECVPTSAEITFVDNTMKEWAKTGAASARDVETMLRRLPCTTPSGIGGYAQTVEIAETTEGMEVCYDTFRGPGNDGMVWEDFPKVGKASYCPNGERVCGNKQKTTSDIYELFNLIDFTEADYTPTEAKMAGQLIAKIEKCSDARLSQSKREMWGSFLTDTIGSVGKKTDTSAIIQAVSGMGGNGSALGGLQSIGGYISNSVNR